VTERHVGTNPLSRLGRYELLQRLSVGGMAEIFLARLVGVGGFDKRVIVKRVLPHLATDKSFIRMFLAEARLTANLQHPNVAQIFEIDSYDGVLFIVMEYVPGHDLGAIVRAQKPGAPLPLNIALAIGMNAARGLDHAHNHRDERGQPLSIVHRDVSPSNILVSEGGAVKVIDFGIARAANRGTVTQQGVLRGKVPYMSPEQIRGDALDRRSDVFSLGTVLYEMSVGRRPFVSDDDFVLARQIPRAEIPKPSLYAPDIPERLEEIVLRALQRDLQHRFQTAAALAQQLESLARDMSLDVSSEALVAFMVNQFPQGPARGVPVLSRVKIPARTPARMPTEEPPVRGDEGDRIGQENRSKNEREVVQRLVEASAAPKLHLSPAAHPTPDNARPPPATGLHYSRSALSPRGRGPAQSVRSRTNKAGWMRGLWRGRMHRLVLASAVTIVCFAVAVVLMKLAHITGQSALFAQTYEEFEQIAANEQRLRGVAFVCLTVGSLTLAGPLLGRARWRRFLRKVWSRKS